MKKDISLKDSGTSLSDSELEFLETIFEATASEFAVKNLAEYQTEPLSLPFLNYRIDHTNNAPSLYSLYIDCDIKYRVLDDTKVTVKERDLVLNNVKNVMNSFVDTRTEDELLNGKEDFEIEMQEVEKAYANDGIQIDIEIKSYEIST